MLGYYRAELIELFSDLNRLKADPADVQLCYSIQERVISRIRRTEYKIRATKKEIENIRNKIKNDRLPKIATAKLRELITQREGKKFDYDQLLYVLRDIGDGIAFIYLSKWDIKPLCMSKEHAGFISGKRGLRLELAIFRRCKRDNIVSILNDITNSLRHGDITIPKYGVPLTIEVKSGRASKNNSRSQRQQDRTKKILEYLVKDKGENIYPGQGTPMQRQALTKRELHHQKRVGSLASQAISSGRNMMRKIEEGLYYHMGVTSSSIGKDMKTLPRSAKLLCHFVNMEKQLKQAYYPFTLSISNPEALFDFYDGQLSITIFVDLNVVESFFVQRGFAYCREMVLAH